MSKRSRPVEHPQAEEQENLDQNLVYDGQDLNEDNDDEVRDVYQDEDEVIARERMEFDVLEDEDDDDGEDLFKEDFLNDYRGHQELDVYEEQGLDDQVFSDLSLADQNAVDAMLNKRDRERARREGRVPAAFIGDDDNDGGIADVFNRMPRRRRRQGDDGASEEGYDPNALDTAFVLDDLKDRTVAQWVIMDQPRLHISHQFRKFLSEFKNDHGVLVYEERIQRMCEQNGRSLEISFVDLTHSHAILALWLADAPAEMLEIFDEVAAKMVAERFDMYSRIVDEIHVRITDLPTVETIRELRHHHVNKLVRISGVVTKRSSLMPQIKYVTYSCARCGHLMGPFYQLGSEEPKLSKCASCEGRGPFNIKSEQTSYCDYQKITLQESPGTVPAGRLPRSKEVILLRDLVDTVRPGEAVEITGIYKNVLDINLNANNGFPLFATVIEANHISKREDAFAAVKLSQEDKQAIVALSKDPRISRRIVKSIAPSIYGHDNIKRAIALSLFGGVAKDIQGKHRLRGDINVLMMGDPGTAKSQFLKYVEKTANRAVFTTGQGASAVGLTASVHKSPVTREWTLEGGALVLADKGVCLIDEFDKMNEQDRTSIHEAMEQQSISVSKAGIICTLQARCAVMAAANPKYGRYNPLQSFQDNVDLTEPILSRFDVLCVVKDVVDVELDQRLADFVVHSHMRSHPDAEPQQKDDADDVDTDLIDQNLLRKYLMYSRENVHPRLTDLDQDKMAKVYSALRRESIACGSIPMTVRHVESMIRMAEAHAKMHLRDYVRQQDLDVAIQVMLESFLASNKLSVQKQLRRKFQKYMNSSQDNEELLHHLVKTIAQNHFNYMRYSANGGDDNEDSVNSNDIRQVKFPAEEFESRAREHNIQSCTFFYKSPSFVKYGYQLVEEVDANGHQQRMIVKNL
ncbi:hypothetical protein MP228_006789 [Amoeboaphelidium protococcarum]|nr:hypothetical protein MP228_006789 [Amoeboaphelidium protococcarum]